MLQVDVLHYSMSMRNSAFCIARLVGKRRYCLSDQYAVLLAGCCRAVRDRGRRQSGRGSVEFPLEQGTL